MAKKKILYVHHVSTIGGASFCLLNLIKALDRSMYEPYVLLKNNGPLAEELRRLCVEVFYMPQLCAIPYNKSLYNWRTVFGYYNVYKCCKLFGDFLNSHYFDLVYLNNMMLYPYLKEIRTNSVIHIREHWPLNEHVKQLAKAQQYVKKYANRIVAINHYSASIFSECKEKTDIVYDWIDMSSRHKNISLNEIFGEDVSDKKVYLFTGGSNWTKGPKTVIETFVNELKGNDKRLLVLGVKPYSQQSAIKEFIKKVLEIFGRKNNHKEIISLLQSDQRIKCMPGIYEIADIMKQAYCNLSFFAIPHANLAMAESIIMGTPCVAALTPESVEYSKNGRLAFLYEFGNKEAFLSAIKDLDTQYEEFKMRLRNESDYVAKMFDTSSNIANINKVLSTIFNIL